MVYVHRRLLIDGGNKNASYTQNTDFDTKMVIVLAASLCALIFALGLNLIVKCAMSYRPRQGEPTTSGLKKQALRQIPVAVYGSQMDFAAMECSICLGEFLKEEKIRVLPNCKHGFHMKCVDKWLVQHSSCPICRCQLLEKKSNSQGAQVLTP